MVGLLTIALSGCEPRRDPYAEHLLEQRNKAIKQLEQKAQRDKSLDVLCWDISDTPQKPNAIKQWATSHKGLDVLALAGSNLEKLKQAADMAEVVNSLDRGWPVVTSTNEPSDDPTSLDKYYVMNANGYRFDGVMTDPIQDWGPATDAPGRFDPPSTLHLQVRYTKYEFILVYLTNCETVTDQQYAALSKWIDTQSIPVIVFGQFDASRLKHPELVTIDPQRLVVSQSIEGWQFSLEDLQSPLGGSSPPYMIRCQEMK